MEQFKDNAEVANQKKKQVINYYLYLLSKRDYTTQELIDKGIAKGFTGGEVKIAITQLKEINYLNDRRFVEVALNTYKGTKGYNWILQKLRRRKVPQAIIENELENIEFLPNEEFQQKVRSKYRVDKFSELEYKEKQKILNYISRQGFNNVFDIMREWESIEREQKK
jgi:regulatory protein